MTEVLFSVGKRGDCVSICLRFSELNGKRFRKLELRMRHEREVEPLG